MHEETLNFFKSEFLQSDTEKVVVVSHHAPLALAEQKENKGWHLSSSFVSNLDDFIKSHNINLWIHGHTHHNVDYMTGKTLVVAIQRAYDGYELCENFNDKLITKI
jgi:Icc-related predicted phosphoesterase